MRKMIKKSSKEIGRNVVLFQRNVGAAQYAFGGEVEIRELDGTAGAVAEEAISLMPPKPAPSDSFLSANATWDVICRLRYRYLFSPI